MEMLILIFGAGLIIAMTFLGTWLMRGHGLSELWAWSRPARDLSGDGRASEITPGQ